MPGHGRNSLASKACDGCRLRKVRCDMTEERSSPDPSVIRQTRNRTELAASRCRRCTRLHLSCTFDRPSKHRGPRRSLFREGSDGQTATATINVAVSPSCLSPASVDGADHFSAVPVSLAADLQGQTSPNYDHLGRQTTPSYPTDGLCTRLLLRRILDDYLRYVYPLIPVVHRPSFRRDVLNDRDMHDKTFLDLILAICAVTIGLMPSLFDEYRTWDPGPPLRFASREGMMDYCHDRLMSLRGPRYFDEINFQKLAISYLMSIAFFQLGDQNSSRMMEVEAMQLGRLLHVHKISEYEGLNHIEAQLRKKGFWLLFYAYVHSQLQNLRKEKVSFLDPILLSSINLEELLPLDVDDEMILEDTILVSDPPGATCLTTAFIIHSRVFWAALLPTVTSPGTEEDAPCICKRWRNLDASVTHWKERLQELKYMLDAAPEQLLPWSSGTMQHTLESTFRPIPLDSPETLAHQFSALRANLHVTHLWLQSIIVDQLDAAVQDHAPDSGSIKKEYWARREEIGRELLHLLHAIPEPDLEPNGLHLTFKIRDIAVGLLNCPYDEGHAASTRAAGYIQQLTLILSRLDRSEKASIVNVQSWVDTDRIKKA